MDRVKKVLATAFTFFFASIALAQETPIYVQEEAAPKNATSTPPTNAPQLSSYEEKTRQCPCLFSARHVLAGHAFLPVIEQPAAFADSRASLGIGVGQGTYGVTTNGVYNNVDLISFAPLLNVQVAINPRLALFVGFSSSITSGLNSESALIYGGSVRYAWNFGGLYEILRSEDSVLSIALQINKPHTLAVSPVESAAQAQQAVISSSDPSFVNTTVATEYRPNLRFAHGFNPSLGIQALVGMDFRSTIESGVSTGGTLFTAALGLSSDLNPWLSVPIGFTLDLSRNQIISRSEQNTNIATVGIWETFTHRFNMGAEIGWVRRGDLDSTIGALLARTYYN
jgi:hypothetical protein